MDLKTEREDNLKNKTISGIFWRFGERIIAQLISFIVSVVIARILIPEQYGIIAIVTIFINIANVFVVSGLGTSLVQSKKTDDIDFSTMFWANLFLSVVLYVIIFFISPLIGYIYNNILLINVIRIMAIKIPIAAFSSIQQAYVQRKMIFKKFFFSTLFGTVISGVVGIYMAISGYGVWALVTQYLTNSIIDTLVLFITIDWRPKLIFSYKRFKKLFGFGWKAMLTSLIGTVFEQLRGLIIGIKYTSTDLAYNNKGEQMPTILATNINATMESVLFSSIAKIQDDRNKVKNAVSRLMKTSSYIIMPIMFGLAASAPILIKILLTDKWLSSVPYMQIVCFAQCFVILNTINMQAIKAVGRSDISLKLEFIKKPIYLVIIILTMLISPLAICIGNAFYSIIALFINSRPNKKLLEYSFVEQIRDVSINLISSFIMMIIVILIGKININMYLLFIIQVLVGVISYVFLSYFTKNESFYYLKNSSMDFIKLRSKSKERRKNVKKRTKTRRN